MSSKQKTTPVDRRYDFVLLFDVQDGNPNGDPDAGNLPRTDPQTLQGFVTDVCIKRKIRNAVAAIAGSQPGYDLYFQTQDAVYEKRVLNRLHEQAYAQPDVKAAAEAAKNGGGNRSSATTLARRWMCSHFFDVRAFGAVMTTGDFNCGQVRGPVQITFARSLDPIVPAEVAITRKSVTNEDDAKKQVEKDGYITGTMGRKSTVPYALYRAHGFINANLAADTGFSWADLAILFQAIQMMFEPDRSASRGLMSVRGLHVFEHASSLGEAPAHLLFDRVITKALGREAAPRIFEDYKAAIKIVADLPEGIVYRDLTSVKISDVVFPFGS